MSGKKRKVLLIEDEVMSNVVHTIMLRQFEQIGEIHSVRNGKEALALLNETLAKGETLPDIIYLDISMPVMDGFELIEKLIAHPSIDFDKLNISILTSSIHPMDMSKVRAMGVAHFFVKPLSEYHIQQSLKTIRE